MNMIGMLKAKSILVSGEGLQPHATKLRFWVLTVEAQHPTAGFTSTTIKGQAFVVNICRVGAERGAGGVY